MLRKIGIAVGVLVVALAVFIGTRPEIFRVERSAQVKAPPSVVYSLINDFQKWNLWSPWERMDPSVKTTVQGPTGVPGAVYSWTGEKTGQGQMTLIENKTDELVSIKLDFIKPFAATNQALFKLESNTAGTLVSWSMEGKNTLMGKILSIFMDMDKMVGKDFEQGLANLDTVAQAEGERRKNAAENPQAKLQNGQGPDAVTPKMLQGN